MENKSMHFDDGCPNVKKQYNSPITGEEIHILTTQELRARLKHIAGLCYSLNCDISNYELVNEEMKDRIAYLETTIRQMKQPKKKRPIKQPSNALTRE